MTENGWARGMALLVANLKAPDHPPDMAMVRGETYRRLLGHLSDDVWFFAVDEAILEPGGWFPGVGDLLNYAARAPQSPSIALPAEPIRSEEERRQSTKDGLKVLRAIDDGLKNRTRSVPRVIAPEEPFLAVASDERLDTLRQQAAEIVVADPEAEPVPSPLEKR